VDLFFSMFIVFIPLVILLRGAWLVVCDKQREWEKKNKDENHDR
tara:strand:+ start:2419 stop:2550 length:132 start_codon:yes stop_codon:yes gene_type:complete